MKAKNDHPQWLYPPKRARFPCFPKHAPSLPAPGSPARQRDCRGADSPLCVLFPSSSRLPARAISKIRYAASSNTRMISAATPFPPSKATLATIKASARSTGALHIRITHAGGVPPPFNRSPQGRRRAHPYQGDRTKAGAFPLQNVQEDTLRHAFERLGCRHDPSLRTHRHPPRIGWMRTTKPASTDSMATITSASPRPAAPANGPLRTG